MRQVAANAGVLLDPFDLLHRCGQRLQSPSNRRLGAIQN
jgi:hypothetical protein